MNNIYGKIKKDLTSKEKFHISLGLERVSFILDLLDNPQNKIKTIHVAGTNGKGSTSAMLASVLEKSGYKTGLFTSPHLIRYNERIKINSNEIRDEDFSALLEIINNTAQKHGVILTEFETLTVAAFLHFNNQNVDIAIIETGLGGRLDATNVITPVFSIITSISYDHTERLGDSIEQIAFEKAGIIKPNSAVIINPQNAGFDTIKNKAIEVNSLTITTPFVESVEFKNEINHISLEGKIYQTNLFGEFQGDNLALVIKAIELLKKNGFQIKDTEKALLNVFWPARMQFLEKNVILDGAHNVDSAKRLKATLDKNFPSQKRTWFFGALKNKDYEQIIKILFSDEDIVYFVEFENPNSCKNPDFINVYSSKNSFFLDIMQFFTVYDKIKNEDELIIICGSLYLAGQILALLVNEK